MSGPRADGLLLGLAALVAYVALGQHTGQAGSFLLLESIARGEAAASGHAFYAALVGLAAACLEPLGVGPYRAACLLSALGGAAGVALGHLALRRLGCGRSAALLAASLAGLCPAVMFFATVVQVNAPAWAFASVAFLAAAELVRRPCRSAAGLLGASTALTTLLEPTGLLLPIALGFFVLAETDDPGRGRQLGLLALAALVHGALAIALYGLLSRPALLTLLIPAAWRHEPDWVLTVLGRDWLRAFLPLSVVSILGLARSRTRATSVALLAALPPYLLEACLLHGEQGSEGGLLLPLVWPASLLTVRLLSRRGAVIVLVASAVLALARVAVHDHPQRSREFAEGLVGVVGEQGCLLLIGDRLDLEAVHVRLPWAQRVRVSELAALAGQHPVMRTLAPLKVGEWLDGGHRVFLTQEAEDLLRDPVLRRRQRGLGLVLDLLRREFDWTLVECSGFRAKELTRG